MTAPVIKICGLTTLEAVTAVNDIKADMAGFNFVEKSTRYVTPQRAGELVSALTPHVQSVALVLDADDVELDAIIATVSPDLIQMHGRESPERVAQTRAKYSLPVIKALSVENADDVQKAHLYEGVADWLLFDAKPPKSLANALPGGNGLVFDWNLLAGFTSTCPWMLSGGLDADNVAEAIRISGATAVDVASGVESTPGVKDPRRIKDFAAAARA